MLSVEDALTQILKDAAPLPSETIPITDITGRVSAADVAAALTQPPFAASAMDGYAVRFADMGEGAKVRVIGEAPAGSHFAGEIAAGEAVRIFTGAAVPAGADHVIIQEDVERVGDEITVAEAQATPRTIRPAGVDFHRGDILLPKGARIHEIHGALLAAANLAEISVIRQPTIAIIANGDELMAPGAPLKPGQIVNSNHYALTAMARQWGAAPAYLGCAKDDEASVTNFFDQARDFDIILPVGGASVGDFDCVKSGFKSASGEIIFEKVAVKPGKPTWLGRLGDARVIGLPGNPAAAIVTAALFVQPLAKLLGGGQTSAGPVFHSARLAGPVPKNGRRESYLRADARAGAAGEVHVTAAANQDSSLLSPFATANALIRRLPDAPALGAGEEVEIVWLRGSLV